MILLYNTLLYLYFILALPWYVLQMTRKEKYRAGLAQRLGRFPAWLFPPLRQRPRIWIHAVSVGETLAVVPLIKLLRREIPGYEIVLSTVTSTGNAVAREKAGDDATVIYFPLDFRFSVNRALDVVKPALVLLVETELWPNFISCAHRRRIPLAIINGRISDRSFPRYLKTRFIFRQLLCRIDLFSMQSAQDAERIRLIGAPPGRIKITGNMKFDTDPPVPGMEPGKGKGALSVGIPEGKDLLVAGSTHQGEEEIILSVWHELRDTFPELMLVIAPRHPERAAPVEEICVERNIPYLLRSQLQTGRQIPGDAVLVVDTMGELTQFYAVATVVFVGKSLVEGGGQNIIEPASLARPVLFGPHMENFREAVALLVQSGGGTMVHHTGELKASIAHLLSHPEEREEMGRRAAAAVATCRGATRRNVQLIKELLSLS